MKKVISFFLAAVILLSTAGFCGCSFLKNNAKLSAGVFNEISSFDPTVAVNDVEKILAANCFEGLYKFNEAGETDLAGATAVSVSPDGLTYTFTLNPEAVWYVSEANEVILGEKADTFIRAVSAEDYIYSIKRTLENKTDGYTRLFCIDGAEGYSKNPTEKSKLGLKSENGGATLIITLKKPFSDLNVLLASSLCTPVNKTFCELADSLFGTTASTVLCNGPYYPEDSSEAGTIVMKRNPDFMGKDAVMNASVTLHYTGKSDYAKSRFEEGVYSVYLTNSTEKLTVDGASSASSQKTVWGIAADCSRPNMKNVELRKALLCAIDYTKIKTPSFSAEAADSVIAKDYIVASKTYGEFASKELSYKTSKKKASAYFADAKAELGSKINVTVAVPEALEASFKKIAEGWEKLFGDGFSAKVITFETDKLDSFLEDNAYDIAVLPVTSDYASATALLDEISSFPCNFNDKKLTTLINKAKYEPDENKKAAALSNAESYVVTSAVFVPLFVSTTDLYQNKGISGIYAAGESGVIYFSAGTEQKNG